MTKEDVIGHLRVANTAHTKWVQKAKILIDKIDINEPTLPVNARESDFGKWFDDDGKKLNGLSNNPLESMDNIEKLHIGLHAMYSNIFNIYCGKSQKKGFFSKMLGFDKKPISDIEETLALEHYETMQAFENDLLNEIKRLERRLTALSDEKIEALS
ncbi:Methyl-accepting chemotaxis protein [hydrothermal vent metagenome]|uniref:Methyl-accepting chemotaxis protein n=1 Tax=hydrothermal vent metagenome TaxID=652676 RepID=A0A1W1CC95_9ZZZZ